MTPRFEPTTLTDLRRRRGLTQTDLAKQLGVSNRTVSEWERGRNCPEINTLPQLAELLRCTIDDLFQPLAAAATP